MSGFGSTRYEAGLTGFAGLPLYLELWRAAGLPVSAARHVAVSGSQGWSDPQMVSALLALNLAGGYGLMPPCPVLPG